MNDEIKINVTATCSQCGHNDFSAAESDPPDTRAICTRCGTDNGSVGEVMAALHEKAHEVAAKQMAALDREFQNLFRNFR